MANSPDSGFSAEFSTSASLRSGYDDNVYYESTGDSDGFIGGAAGFTASGGPSLKNNFFTTLDFSADQYLNEEFISHNAFAAAGWQRRFSLWTRSILSAGYYYYHSESEYLQWNNAGGPSASWSLALRPSPAVETLLGLSGGYFQYPNYIDIEGKEGRSDSLAAASAGVVWRGGGFDVGLTYRPALVISSDETVEFSSHQLQLLLGIYFRETYLRLKPAISYYNYPKGWYDFDAGESGSRTDLYWLAALIVSRSITDSLEIEAEYQYQALQSSHSLYDYQRQTLLAELTYRFYY